MTMLLLEKIAKKFWKGEKKNRMRCVPEKLRMIFVTRRRLRLLIREDTRKYALDDAIPAEYVHFYQG